MPPPLPYLVREGRRAIRWGCLHAHVVDESGVHVSPVPRTHALRETERTREHTHNKQTTLLHIENRRDVGHSRGVGKRIAHRLRCKRGICVRVNFEDAAGKRRVGVLDLRNYRTTVIVPNLLHSSNSTQQLPDLYKTGGAPHDPRLTAVYGEDDSIGGSISLSDFLLFFESFQATNSGSQKPTRGNA